MVNETASTNTQIVPNPEHADLEKLRVKIMQADPLLRPALDKAAQDMASGKVWTSKAAGTWMREVTGRQQKLGPLVQALIDAVNLQLQTTPRECTLAQAQRYRKWRSMEY